MALFIKSVVFILAILFNRNQVLVLKCQIKLVAVWKHIRGRQVNQLVTKTNIYA